MRGTAAVVGLLCLAAAAAFAAPEREAAAPEALPPSIVVAPGTAQVVGAGAALQGEASPSVDVAPVQTAAAASAVAASIEAERAAAADGRKAAVKTGRATSFNRESTGGRFLSAADGAGAAAQIASAQPDVVFDGRKAASADALARMAAKGLLNQDVAGAIAGARDMDAAMADLVRLGLLKPAEVPASAGLRRALAARVWDAVSPPLLRQRFGVDHSWAAPAIRVENDGVAYLIHPIQHGWLFAPNFWSVRKLVRQIAARGEELFTEERGPAYYGFSYGRELNDYSAETGAAPASLPAGQLAPRRSETVASDRLSVLSLHTFASAALVTAAHAFGGAPALALVALVCAAGAWLLLTGFLGYQRLRALRLMRRAARAGWPDVAAQLAREQRAFYRRRLDPSDILRLSLPPDAVGGLDPYAARSQAMADAVRADAVGHVVHVLVGRQHAAHVAWRLGAHRGDRKS